MALEEAGAVPQEHRQERDADATSGDGLARVPVAYVIIIFEVLIAVGLVSSLIQIWPAAIEPTVTPNITHALLWWHIRVSGDVNLLLVAVLAGAVGGEIHSIKSTVAYFGSHHLKSRWIPFQLTLPIVGSLLALIFYFVVRGGLTTTIASSGDINAYGIAAISGLTGLFTNQAFAMLKQVFEAIFKPATEGKDPLPNGQPQAPAKPAEGS